jgi:hypothetical protein
LWQFVSDPDNQNFEETADFDADGDTDGFDFLTWQRGFGSAHGTASPAAGDANADGEVDGDDLSAWQTDFDTVTTSQNASASADTEAGEPDLAQWQANFGVELGALPAAGDADADGDVDGSDLLAWQLSTSVAVAQSVSLVGEAEVLAALTAIQSSAPGNMEAEEVSALDTQIGQAALAKLHGLDAGSQRAPERVAAADEVFHHWQPRDLSLPNLRWLRRHRAAYHQRHSDGPMASHLPRSHGEDARDIALESGEALEPSPFSLIRPWRG